MKAYICDGKVFVRDENEFQHWVTIKGKNGKSRHILINVYGKFMGEERYNEKGERLDSKSGLPIKRKKRKRPKLTKEDKELLKRVERIRLDKQEFAIVMGALNSDLSDDEKDEVIFIKCIGNYAYTVYNDGKGGFVIIGRDEIEDILNDLV